MMNQLLMSVLSQRKSVPVEPGENYVRFVSVEARAITPKYTNSGVTLQYSIDSGATWTTISSGASTTSATEHWFRGQATGTKTLFTSSTYTNAWTFSGNSDLEVYGNLNFLLCDTLGDEEAPTSLASNAYSYMFNGCTSLTTAPELPATTLGEYCYYEMFRNCTSLTTAPELPATTLANYCYKDMFRGCTSLTTAPKLPATTLADYCYQNMFRGCTSFKVSATQTEAYTYAWRIPTSGTGAEASGWNSYMLYETGGTFKSNPSINTTYYVENEPVSSENYVRFVSVEARAITPKYTNSGVTLQYSIDSGATWTTISSESETTSATEHWFRGEATGTKSLFTSTASTNAWVFSGNSDLEVYGNLNFLLCDTLGDDVAPTSLGTYAYAYMFYNCTSLTVAPELPATTLATWCYGNMFFNCTKLTTAPKLPATTLANYCYTNMFINCLSLTIAPELPATTLATYCYYGMFRNCTSFKVSSTNTGSYVYAWRIPTSGTGTTASNWNGNMLANTGGTFTSNPDINTTYYVENEPVSSENYVRFYDFQGTGNTLLKTETVISGGNATPPADPTRTGYQFTGWSPPYTNITTNTDIYGQWVEAVSIENYVRFVSAEARTITPKYTNSGVTLQYSVDSGATWTTIASGSATTSATEHWFRGQATGTKALFTSSTVTNAWAFSGNSDLEVYGNLNFLLCDTLGDEVAPTSLATYAYAQMFRGCTSLTVAPELPATTLADYCYCNMFNGCTSLTTAPELPATTLESLCYDRMFQDCTSLTTAPELPATTLGSYCYCNMFRGCTSLTVAPELPATTLADYCYCNMFRGCTSFKVSATNTGSYVYSWRIPTSGTGTTAPNWNAAMLYETGGTFTSDPAINTTYYVENKPV